MVVVSYKRLLYSFKQLQSPTGSSKNNGQVIILLSIHVSDIFAYSAVADINPNEKNTKTKRVEVGDQLSSLESVKHSKSMG